MIAYLLLTIEATEFIWNTYYVRFAVNPFRGEVSPWGYRLLTPLLVYILPLSIPSAFYALNIAMIAATAFLLVMVCRHMGVRNELAGLAILPYLLSQGINWQIREIWFNDAVSHVCLVLAVMWMLKQKHAWLSLISTIGVMNRSTALYLAPVWYVYTFGWKINKTSIWQSLYVWGPPIVMLLLIQNVYYPSSAFKFIRDMPQGFDKGSFWSFYTDEFITLNPSIAVLLQRMFSWELWNAYFGTLLPVCFLGLWKCAPEHRRFSFWLLIVWLQFAIAQDIGRLETYAFPVLIPFALLTVQQYTENLPYRYCVPVLLGLLFWFFPSNIIAGFFFAAALIAIRKVFPPDTAVQERAATDPIPLSKLVITAAAVCHVFIFVGFLLFCWKTYTLRPTLLLSFPPQYVDQVYQLAFFNEDGSVPFANEVTEQRFGITQHLQLGNPESNYKHIGIALPQFSDQPMNAQLFMWGNTVQGDSLYLNAGALLTNGYIRPKSNEFAMIYTNLGNPLVYEIDYTIHPSDHLLCFYNVKDWRGSFQFILSDATELHAMKKATE